MPDDVPDDGVADGDRADDDLVFVMADLFDGRPVLTVFHEHDGDWQYLTGGDPTPETARIVHRSHVIETDPSLAELASMPRGRWATRTAPGEPWTFGDDAD